MITEEGEILRGNLATAYAIAQSWCEDNPHRFNELIDGWMEDVRAADDTSKTFNRKWQERLAFNPKLAAALADGGERGVAMVCERAQLTPFQTRTVEMYLDGRTPTEIAFALGLNSRQAAHDRISKALERILAMDLEEAEAV